MKKFKQFTLFLFFFLAITIVVAEEHRVPQAAWSVSAADIDLDGDVDIVIGHSTNNDWSGISFLYNNDGVFSFTDSLYLDGKHSNIWMDNFDDNHYIDLVTRCYNDTNHQICILYDIDNTTRKTTLDLDDFLHAISSGDLDADGDNDIVFISNRGSFWGWIYNEGNGNFSEPNYHYYNENYPSDIACGDINGDGRADVGVSAQTTRVYFSYPDSFKAVILEENGFKDNIIFTDMDKDGDKDVVVSENLIFGLTTNTTYEYIGNDSFLLHEEKKFIPSTSRLEVCDVNNDSLPDMVYTALDGIYVLYNEGNFILSDPVFFPIPNYGENSRRSFCADLDGDGFKDVVTVRTIYEEIPSNVNILYNDGTGHFQNSSPVGINENEQPKIPQDFSLSNFPNPFNNSTTIEYTLKKFSQVSIEIYNSRGQQIKQLLNNKPLNAGVHTLVWHGRAKDGATVSSGVYVALLKTNDQTVAHKLLLIK